MEELERHPHSDDDHAGGEVEQSTVSDRLFVDHLAVSNLFDKTKKCFSCISTLYNTETFNSYS